ncbi:alpha/beta fold hydrolase [Patescibacteria group bacterium]|nr:alpha/beta fold hydrolase [Patescibacteria group bacterium]
MKYITFKSKDRLNYNAIILGDTKAKKAYIFIHGLSGDMFSRYDLNEKLAKKSRMLLSFNNRGQGIINKFKKEDTQSKKGYKSKLFGSALEKFTDCKYDIQGAVDYLKSIGVKEIYLVGHSTGCQKSVYYLAKTNDSVVKGAVLLAPISDYSAIMSSVHPDMYTKALKEALRMKKNKQADKLLPNDVWFSPISAQRFLSLYTLNSTEEIFSYGSKKPATLLKKVDKKLLVFLAEKDEHNDKDNDVLKSWFEKNIKKTDKVFVIDEANHGFQGQEKSVVDVIHKYF